MRNISKILLYTSIFFILIACSESDDQQTGISEAEILLGSSSALGGHASFLGTQYQKGSMAWFNELNAAGGVHGRKIRLISYDDKYDPPLTVENTKRLIDDDEVFALFNYVGTPTSVKIIDIVNEANIPAFGFFTGAEALRTPFRPNMFHVRASYYEEAEGAIKYFVDDLGFKDIAVFYQDDAFGLAVLEGVNQALNRRDIQIADTATYIRGETEVKGAVKRLANSKAQAVIMVGTYKPLAKFVKLSHFQRYFPYFHTVSFVGSKAYGLELKGRGVQSSELDKIIVTQVVPSPHANEEAIVSEYRELIKKYFPDEKPNYVSLEGYINAKILTAALKIAGKELTRTKLIEAIQGINNLDIGIGKNLVYGPQDHQGLNGIYYSKLGNDGNFHVFNP